MYCRVNMAVPVLDRFFDEADTRQDIRLSRESLAMLLNLLQQDRRDGWSATIVTKVFLFSLASGASYRVASRVCGMCHYWGCLWNDEDQVQVHPPASAGGAPHLCASGMSSTGFLFCGVLKQSNFITACAILHNICLGAGDIMPPYCSWNVALNAVC